MDEKIKALRLEKGKLIRSQKYYEDKQSKYDKKYWQETHKIEVIEKQLKQLTHHYKKGDLVVTTRKYVGGTEEFATAEIQSLIGAKMYRVFEYFAGGGCGTIPTIHESSIVCKVQSIKSYFELTRKKDEK